MNKFLCKLGIVRPKRAALAVGLAIVGILHSANAKSAELNVVTDIAPVHSLVSMVLAEKGKVTLLVPASSSPHTYNLKPSQRRALDNAELVVMLSQHFTPSLGRHLKSSNNSNSVLTLSSIEHDHSDKHEEHSNNDAQLKYTVENDPHAWLNPLNAIDWLDRIAMAASKLDEINADFFKQNAQLAKQQLTSLHQSIDKELTPVRAESYIVYHDAYQHFAKSYSLQAPISIAVSDARAPGAAKLSTVRKQAASVTCAFSELQHDDSIIDTVVERLSIKRGILDPMGSSLDIGKTLYPTLMRSLAKSFLDCLG